MQLFIYKFWMFWLCGILAYFAEVGLCVGQTDNVGSGRAISFDGVDDLVNYGDTYKDLKYPFTISAWIYLAPSTAAAAPIFSNRNCDPVYTGFRLIVNTNVISLEYGDGLGGNSPSFRRGIQATVDYLPGSWNHITAVVENMNSMRLYLNGINVGGTFTGTSSLPMDSGKPGFGSTAYFISNGTEYRFKGVIDEIRLWNKALTEADVKSTMCLKLMGTEPGLIGYWNFDEIGGTTVFDKTSSHVNGSFQNGPKRVYSGAPIGDESTLLYNTSMTGKSTTLVNGDGSLKVDNVDNLAGGVQVYYVRSLPSQTAGLDPDVDAPGYFGVFLAKQGQAYHYKITYIFKGQNACALYSRSDNSIIPWNVNSSPIPKQEGRGEYIYKTSGAVVFDLGKDTTVCNASTLMISTGLPNSYSFSWNTGQSTASIDVTSGGKYKVKVQGSCGTSVDSINVFFSQAPVKFSLGPDSDTCPFTPQTLKAPEGQALEYEWQDGSGNSTFLAASIGKYWVSVSNTCGEQSDTIRFQTVKQRMDVDLGQDKIICDQKSTTLTAGTNNSTYEYLWSNGETEPTIIVDKPGVYTLQISSECLFGKDTVAVEFLKTPQPFSLGEDYKQCSPKPILLNAPFENDYSYEWHDGSTHPSFAAFNYGVYWVKVSNQCGDYTDSLNLIKPVETIGFIPNVITPNGDKRNDTFVIEDVVSGEVSLRVINRWGNEVYFSSAYKNDWDAQEIPSGVYFIEVFGSCISKKHEVLTVLKSD